MATPMAETNRPVQSYEVLRLPRRPIPFLSDILRLGIDEQISIPLLDATFLTQQQHGATENYLLTQMVRRQADRTGIIAPLIGYATDPSESAAYAAASAQHALDEIEVARGHKAKISMLGVVFEEAEPTLDDLLNWDKAWGATVRELKFAENAQATAFRQRNLDALNRLANGRLITLAGRECEGGGCDGSRLVEVTESLTLPNVPMPELEAIVPPLFKHDYGKPKEKQTDVVRFLRRGGVIGNDLTRAVLDAIKSRRESQLYIRHQESLP